MIEAEKKDKKYDVELHKIRLEKILENWEKILEIVKQDIPSSERLEEILDAIKAPKSMAEIGLDESLLADTFRATADIRYKYILSHLTFDLGVREELLK